MFTGLIQQKGKLSRTEKRSGGLRMFIASGKWQPSLAKGESIAVNGVCLTVANCKDNQFVCDVLQETLERTSLGSKRRGSSLNIERALRLGDAMGGHIVTGHVDGKGTVILRKAVGRDWVFRIACNQDILQKIILKGSIACDGVSLTVAELNKRFFAVHIIPYTWTHTALCELKEGDSMNIELDVIGKYVRRYMETQLNDSKLTIDRLREAGFCES